MKEISESVLRVPLKSPIDAAHANWKSYYIDLQGFESAIIEVEIGALTGEDASNYLLPALMEYNPADGVTPAPQTATNYTAVAAANMRGSFLATDAAGHAGVIQRVGYKGSSRYLYVSGAYTGTALSAGIVGVSVILCNPGSAPITIVPTTGAVS